MTIASIDEEMDGIYGMSAVPTTTQVNANEATDLEEKTQAVALDAIAQTSHPTGSSTLKRVVVGEPLSTEERDTLLNDFPQLAWEAIKAGLAKEEIMNRTLNGYIQEAETSQQSIDLLLDLSAALTSMKEEMKEEETQDKMKTVKNLLNELKERGIDLKHEAEKPFTKEEIAELKSLSSAQVDKLRSNVQILFTTKIQPAIQSISSIMEILKDIIRNNNALISKANRLPGQ